MIEQQVRERAYYIWEGEGRVCGRAHAHWIQAETEMAAVEQAPPMIEALPAAAKAKPAAKVKSRPAKTVAAKAPAHKAAVSAAPAKKAVRRSSAEALALH